MTYNVSSGTLSLYATTTAHIVCVCVCTVPEGRWLGRRCWDKGSDGYVDAADGLSSSDCEAVWQPDLSHAAAFPLSLPRQLHGRVHFTLRVRTRLLFCFSWYILVVIRTVLQISFARHFPVLFYFLLIFSSIAYVRPVSFCIHVKYFLHHILLADFRKYA